MSRIAIIIPDNLVTIDGETYECNLDVQAIQQALKKYPKVKAIHWEGGSGYVETFQGLSRQVNDTALIRPFKEAWKVGKRKAQKAEEKQANEEAAAKKKFDDFQEARKAKHKQQKEEEEAFNKEQERLEAAFAAQNKAEAAWRRAADLLADSDIIVLRLHELSQPVPHSWIHYREELREIVRREPPDITKVRFPRKPPKPKVLT